MSRQVNEAMRAIRGLTGRARLARLGLTRKERLALGGKKKKKLSRSTLKKYPHLRTPAEKALAARPGRTPANPQVIKKIKRSLMSGPLPKKDKRRKCHYCGCTLTKATVTADHVVPRSKGGENAKDNIVLSCSPCNVRKGSMSYDVFLKLIATEPPHDPSR